MVDTWSAITTRRQVREYGHGGVDDEQILRIIEAAGRAPSARNRQRWDFVVVENQHRIQRLSHVWQGAAWTVSAPVVVALVVPAASSPEEHSSIRFDLGQSAMLMMIAATDAGLASGQANCQDQDLARTVLQLPDDRECAMLIAIGPPANGAMKPMLRPDRRALTEIVHRDVW